MYRFIDNIKDNWNYIDLNLDLIPLDEIKKNKDAITQALTSKLKSLPSYKSSDLKLKFSSKELNLLKAPENTCDLIDSSIFTIESMLCSKPDKDDCDYLEDQIEAGEELRKICKKVRSLGIESREVFFNNLSFTPFKNLVTHEQDLLCFTKKPLSFREEHLKSYIMASSDLYEEARDNLDSLIEWNNYYCSSENFNSFVESLKKAENLVFAHDLKALISHKLSEYIKIRESNPSLGIFMG